MTFRPELLDELLQSYQNPEDLLGNGGILKQLTAALVERCLNAELEHHLEEDRTELAAAVATRNRRNGHSKKTIKGEFGEAEIAIPRDRNSAFEPIIVQKGQTRFDGFDGKILSLYARGMSVRDIQAQLQELYGVEVSAGLISKVTDAVEEERKLCGAGDAPPPGRIVDSTGFIQLSTLMRLSSKSVRTDVWSTKRFIWR